MRTEWLVLLEPHAERLQELLEQIEGEVSELDADHLQRLVSACEAAKVAPEDVHWAVAKVSPLVERTARIEMDRREGHAKLRESLAL